ncbi:hypothetical protein [Trichothermofontia sp.]
MSLAYAKTSLTPTPNVPTTNIPSPTHGNASPHGHYQRLRNAI